MKEMVLKYIKQEKLIECGDKVLVALSGGPDSVALLSLLHEFKDILGITLGAAHVNHGLRGISADEDELYAKNLCDNYNVKFYSTKIDIHKISKEKNISCEMAGREERYNFFYEIRENEGYNKIAVAHNANDQAETIIMRLMRGTGLEGLEGIKSKRDDVIIRPILCLSREQIEEYCNEKKLQPRIDESNLQNIYSRNKIRLDMIPYIKNNFNKDIVNTLNRFSKLIKMDNEYITNETEEKLRECINKKSNNIIINKSFFSNHEAIVTRGIRSVITKLKGSSYNIEMKHIYDIIELQKGKTNKRINLPLGIFCENIYGDIKIYKERKKEFSKENEIILNKEDINGVKIEYGEYELSFIVEKNKKNIDFRANNLIKYFNYDNIRREIIIRSRKNGDKMIPIGMKSNKKLKDIFINEKIPTDQRNEIPILLFDDEIVYIVGLKTSNNYKVKSSCEKILKVVCDRKE